MRRMLATALTIVYVFTSNPGYAALAPGQTPSEGVSDLRQQLTMIPPGTVVEVRLQQNNTRKITGKLGPVTNEGFEIQTTKSGQISSESIRLADVGSVKAKKGMRQVYKILIIVGVVYAVFYGIYALGLHMRG